MSPYARQWIGHRAKAFAGFFVPAFVGAILEGIERSFDFQLGSETKLAIIGFLTSQVVYWVSNGPKEGTI